MSDLEALCKHTTCEKQKRTVQKNKEEKNKKASVHLRPYAVVCIKQVVRVHKVGFKGI
jgi:hypothetical protein